MSNLSKDQKDKKAIKDINAMETVEAVQEYIAGEDRQDVLDAAQLQIELIERTAPSSPQAPASATPPSAVPQNEPISSAEKPAAGASPLKQGEEPGPITQKTHDFKGGVQGAKSEMATGSDIIEKIDKADEKKAMELDRRAAEEKAAQDRAKEDAAGPKNYVTGEDVIKKMRAEGKKI